MTPELEQSGAATGMVLGWGWTVVGIGAAALSFHAGQTLAGVTLLLSALAACPLTAWLYEKQARARLGGGLRLALVVIFAGLAGLSFELGGGRLADKPVAAVPLKVLLQADANGNTKTASFTTTGPEWTLNWSFDCAVLGDSGIFNVKVMRKDGSVSDNAPVEKIDAADSGVAHYKQGGTFYLDITSECPWHVRVDG